MDMMGIIFSNIYDNNMGELTRERTSASIPFGGRYRQIDFILSNMANSGIRDIGIITKYNYQSLMDHLGNCDEWDLKLGDGVRFLPPYATGHTGAYRGKLEALPDGAAGARAQRQRLCGAGRHDGALHDQFPRGAGKSMSSPAATSRSSPRPESVTASSRSSWR